MSARTELLNLAVRMAKGHGLPPEYPDDYAHMRSGPAREAAAKTASIAAEQARLWAIEAKRIADMLQADCNG